MDTKPSANWAAVAVAASVVVAAVSAAWTIRGSHSDQRIQQCSEELNSIKSSKDWNLPATLHALKEASDVASLSLGERKELVNLRQEAQSLRESLASHTDELSAAQVALSKAQADLARVFPSEEVAFEIEKGQAREVVPRLVVIALADGSSATGVAKIKINGELGSVGVGDTLDRDVGGKSCSILALQVDYSRMSGILRCTPKK